MGNDDSDDRIDQLRARVAQLEQQVPDGPTRRQVLAGGGLLGLGGLLGGGATEQVRAQQAAGQVGTESEPVDVHGATGEFGSVKAEQSLNGVLWANNPDQLNDRLSQLPDRGGRVVLKPGVYTDSDWSETVVLPDNRNNQRVILDLSLANVQLSEFAGPYIEKREDDSVAPNQVEIYGPKFFDVGDVTDPGTVMDLWDVEQSIVYWPDCHGSVDAIYHEHAGAGSGHWNRVHVGGRHPIYGIIIGDPDHSPSCDRSIYYGQIARYGDAAVEIRGGGSNRIYVQPEKPKSSAVDPAGIRDLTGGNYLYNTHIRGDSEVKSTPFDVRSSNTVIEVSSFQGWWNCQIGTKPSNISAVEQKRVVMDRWLDPLSAYDSGATGGGSTFYAGTDDPVIDAGTSGGDSAYFQTPRTLGSAIDGIHMWAKIELRNLLSNRRDRFGAYIDDSNHIMLEHDASDTGTWNAVIREDGVDQRKVDTGIAPSYSPQRVCIYYSQRGEQFNFYVDNDQVAHFDYTPNSNSLFYGPNPRLDTSVRGSAPKNIQTGIHQFETAQYGPVGE